jgi:hypothetical protein
MESKPKMQRRSLSPKQKKEKFQTKTNLNERNLLTIFKTYLLKKKKFSLFEEFNDPKQDFQLEVYQKFYQNITTEEGNFYY